MGYLIGIDMGTTNLKAVLFDEAGRMEAESRHPTPTMTGRDGGSCYEPERLWQIVCGLLKDVTGQLEEKRGRGAAAEIRGLSVTGMGEAGVPLDAEGRPLFPVIAWFDPRTKECSEMFRQTVGDERIRQITGLRNQFIFTANKILWLKTHEPERFSKMRRWHCVPDYITWRLTGESAMDHSLSCRTMLFDLDRAEWSDELVYDAGICREILPETVPSGSLVGAVTKPASEQTGLPAGTGVYAGGHDHICGAFACGVWEEGSVMDSSGTAEEILMATSSLRNARQAGCRGFNTGYHVKSGRYYLSGGIPASGTSVDWSARLFGPGSGPMTPLAHGLLFLPHLRGSSSPERSRASSGAFFGIREDHHPGDFRQAVLEGVCFEMRQLAESLGTAERVVAIGGGTKNEAWLKTKANVLGTRIEVPEVRESTALGAAMLAGIGAGVYRDAEDALQKTYRTGHTVDPEPEYRERYERQYEVFRELYPCVSGLNTVIEEMKKGV